MGESIGSEVKERNRQRMALDSRLRENDELGGRDFTMGAAFTQAVKIPNGCRQGWFGLDIIDARGRAGSTGAFWNGLQAEVSSHSLNRWQSLTDNREFALAA